MIVERNTVTGVHAYSSAELLDLRLRSLFAETVDACGFTATIFAELLRNYLQRRAEDSPGGAEQAQLVDVREHEVDKIAEGDAAAGWHTLQCGENAVAVLCGGMATRFGGSIKALAEVFPGKRFLDLAIGRILALGAETGAPLATVIVTGPQTHRPIEEFVHRHWPEEVAADRMRLVRQRAFPRIGTDGTPVAAGRFPVFYPPGHGDVPATLAEHGVIDWLVGRGVRRVFFWGIDNLLAGADSSIAGAHLRCGRSVTVEVTTRRTSEGGGRILRRKGRIVCIEDFRLAADKRVADCTLLNTNSMVINVEVLRRPPALPFYDVEKHIGGQVVVQFERLLGEITHYLDCAFLLVPRDGPASRFAPIKTEAEMRRCCSSILSLRQAAPPARPATVGTIPSPSEGGASDA